MIKVAFLLQSCPFSKNVVSLYYKGGADIHVIEWGSLWQVFWRRLQRNEGIIWGSVPNSKSFFWGCLPNRCITEPIWIYLHNLITILVGYSEVHPTPRKVFSVTKTSPPPHTKSWPCICNTYMSDVRIYVCPSKLLPSNTDAMWHCSAVLAEVHWVQCQKEFRFRKAPKTIRPGYDLRFKYKTTNMKYTITNTKYVSQIQNSKSRLRSLNPEDDLGSSLHDVLRLLWHTPRPRHVQLNW